jgi:photosystem II stability/assembly factor-like uncharacterized protein
MVRRSLAAAVLVGALVALWPREPEGPAGATVRPIAEDLLDVAVGTEGRIWAVGHHGRILRSVDGGGSWSFPDSGVDTPLAAVRFRDANVGIAAGYQGVVLRTEDGGATWTRQPSGVDVYLTSLAWHGEEAFAAGEWGTILWSGDGGRSWMKRTEGENDFIVNEIDVADGGHGFAVGELGIALETKDGGRSWTSRRLVIDETTLFSVDLVSASEIWVAGSGSLLLHSIDGGITWQRFTAPCPPTQLLRLRAAGERVYAVGRRCAVVSTDGGRSWRRSKLAESTPYAWLYGLYLTPEVAWAVGYRESVFHTSAGDEAWSRVAVDSRRNLGS